MIDKKPKGKTTCDNTMTFGELSAFYVQAELIFDATYDIVTSKMKGEDGEDGEDGENIYDVVDDTVNRMTHHECTMFLTHYGMDKILSEYKDNFGSCPSTLKELTCIALLNHYTSTDE